MRLIRTLFVAGLFSTAMLADPPAAVVQLVRDAAETLANDDAAGFLDKVDRNMAAYADLTDRIRGMLAANEVSSSIEIASDAGDDQSRVLELDWLLILNRKNDLSSHRETRRQLVKCRVERRGRHWKITALEPSDFFR